MSAKYLILHGQFLASDGRRLGPGEVIELADGVEALCPGRVQRIEPDVTPAMAVSDQRLDVEIDDAVR